MGKTVYKYLKTFQHQAQNTPPMSSKTTVQDSTFQLSHGTFRGALRDGKPHGFGVIEFDSGATYHGDVKMGMRHGHGTYTTAKGRTYEGEWENNNLHGFATITYRNGGQFTGNFKMGQKHGNGRKTYVNGWVVEGTFEEDVCIKVNGLSKEELNEILSKKVSNMCRIKNVIDRRKAREEVASKRKYNCPVTLELMEDPVVASDGYTYERAAIERVIELAKVGGYQAKSPRTNLPLEHILLTPNRDFKSNILGAVDRVVTRKRKRDKEGV